MSSNKKRLRTDDSSDDDSETSFPENCSMEYMRGYLHGTCLRFAEMQILPKLMFLQETNNSQNEIKEDIKEEGIKQYAQFLLVKGLAQDWKALKVLPQTQEVFTLWHYHMKEYSLDYCSLLATLQRSSVFQTEKELQSYISTIPEFAPTTNLVYEVLFPFEKEGQNQ